MSLVRASGGLGNQLFQYAFADWLRRNSDQEIFMDSIDYDYFKHTTPRRLDILNIDSVPNYFVNSGSAIHHVLARIPNRRIGAFLYDHEKKLRKFRFRHLNLVTQDSTVYDQSISADLNCYFQGSFTSPQYWGLDSTNILASMKLLLGSHESLSISPMDNSSGVLAIHARRGDYVSSRKTNEIHGSYGSEYYLSAINHIRDLNINFERVIISSDSPAYSYHLASILPLKNICVEVHQNSDALLTLKLLARSNFFIGSNSTFSWWASHINARQVNVFPKKWFRKNTFGFDVNRYFLNEPVLLDANFEE
jgi:hypothetical protein